MSRTKHHTKEFKNKLSWTKAEKKYVKNQLGFKNKKQIIDDVNKKELEEEFNKEYITLNYNYNKEI